MTQRQSTIVKKDYNYWLRVNRFSNKLYGSILLIEILGFLLGILFLLTFILDA